MDDLPIIIHTEHADGRWTYEYPDDMSDPARLVSQDAEGNVIGEQVVDAAPKMSPEEREQSIAELREDLQQFREESPGEHRELVEVLRKMAGPDDPEIERVVGK